MAIEETQNLSASVEDYLEAIYRVVRRNQAALPRDIREMLNVGRSSVSGALKHLTEMGLVNHEAYGVITLTEEGEAIAREVVRKHGILKRFFTDVLQVEEAEADSTACAMEHLVDDAILERFREYAEYVSRCPDAEIRWTDGVGFHCGDRCEEERCDEAVSAEGGADKSQKGPFFVREH